MAESRPKMRLRVTLISRRRMSSVEIEFFIGISFFHIGSNEAVSCSRPRVGPFVPCESRIVYCEWVRREFHKLARILLERAAGYAFSQIEPAPAAHWLERAPAWYIPRDFARVNLIYLFRP